MAVSYRYGFPTGLMGICRFALVLVFAAALRRLVVPAPLVEPIRLPHPLDRA